MRKFVILVALWVISLSARPQEMLPVWAKSMGGPGWDIARTMCVTPSGEVIITGNFTDSITIEDRQYYSAGNTDVYVSCYSSNGEFAGAFTFGGEGYEFPVYAVNDDENAVLAVKYHRPFGLQGAKIDSLNQTNYLIAWLDAGGKLLCHKIMAGKNSINITGMETDKQGTVFLTGWFTDTLQVDTRVFAGEPGENAFVATLKNDGKKVAVSHWPASEAGRIYACSPGDGNTLDIAGTLTGNEKSPLLNVANEYLYCASVKDDRIAITDTLLKGIDIKPASIRKLKRTTWVVSSYKYFYIIGDDSTYAKGQSDILMASIPEKKGEPLIRSIGGYGKDLPLKLLGSGEQVVLAGLYADTIWFDESKWLVSEKWGSDLFLAAFDSDGNPVKTITLGKMYNDFPCAVAAADAGVYVLGQFKSAIELGENKFETCGSYDVFVARFENCGAKAPIEIYAEAVSNSKGGVEYLLSIGDGYTNYQWSNGLGYGQTALTAKAKTYTVEATDQFGCPCTGEIDLSAMKSALLDGDGTQLSNATQAEFRLYPTVTRGVVYWLPGSKFPESGATLRVYDTKGSVLLTREYPALPPLSVQTLDMGNPVPGQYLVHITGNGFNESVKVIVK